MLVTCPDCGYQVSEAAYTCPRCGFLRPGKHSQEYNQRLVEFYKKYIGNETSHLGGGVGSECIKCRVVNCMKLKNANVLKVPDDKDLGGPLAFMVGYTTELTYSCSYCGFTETCYTGRDFSHEP